MLKCVRVECFQISAGDTVCSALGVVNHLTPVERNGNVQQEIIPQNITCCQVIALEFKMTSVSVLKKTFSVREVCICSSKQRDDVTRHRTLTSCLQAHLLVMLFSHSREQESVSQ